MRARVQGHQELRLGRYIPYFKLIKLNNDTKYLDNRYTYRNTLMLLTRIR